MRDISKGRLISRPGSPQSINELPLPGVEALAHSQELRDFIHEKLDAAGGCVPFRLFMDWLLYAPGLGYYSAGSRKLGEAGDFVTAPEISSLFSACLAAQCRQVLDYLQGGSILEFGAGSGVMAADILATLETWDSLPESYQILEVSADLRQRQRQTLAERVPHLLDRICWLDALPDKFDGVMLANEVLDAMPVHLVQINAQGGIDELYVEEQAEGYAWCVGPVTDAAIEQRLASLIHELGSGYCTEVNLAAELWLQQVAAVLQRGSLVLIDYGFPRREYYHPQRRDGTLMCHYRHRAHGDPFIYPGLQDITAHVDFTAVVEAGAEAGLSLSGYTSQAMFLLANGMDGFLAQRSAQLTDEAQRITLADQVKKLTLPHEMGELFKVMVLSRGLDDLELQGFALNDQSGRL